MQLLFPSCEKRKLSGFLLQASRQIMVYPAKGKVNFIVSPETDKFTLIAPRIFFSDPSPG